MLNSVIVARDRFLKPGGAMLPHEARILCAPVNMQEHLEATVGFWQQPIMGFNMSAMAPLAAQRLLSEPLITDVKPAQLLAPPAQVACIDCATVTLAELRDGAFGGALPFLASRSGVCHGYAIFFEVIFPAAEGAAEGVTLSTAPSAPSTHWRQTVVWLPEMLMATEGSSRLDCTLTLRSDAEQPRMCVLELEV
jgi:hypothetical protein